MNYTVGSRLMHRRVEQEWRLNEPLRREPIARRSLVEELAFRLRERIRCEAFTPGDRIGTKTELASQYGVSAATVNAAVRLLDAAGIVEAKPGVRGGVFVSRPQPRVQVGRVQISLRDSGDQTLAEDSYRSRVLLEILLVRLAARYRTTDDIRGLKECRDRLQGTYGRDLTLYMHTNWELHVCIAQAAHDDTLLAVYRALMDVVVSDVDRISDQDGQRRRDGSNLQLHLRLVDSIIAGDVEAATAAAEEHAERILAGLGRRTSATAPASAEG